MLALIFTVAIAAATPEPIDIPFVTTQPTKLHATAGASAKVVKIVPPFRLLRVVRQDGSWLEVVDYEDSDTRGWLNGYGQTQNLLPDAYAAAARLSDMDPAWPLAARIEIARGRTKPGFTAAMVLVAMNGEPEAKRTSETAAGTVERWLYGMKVITLTNGKVTEIETVEGKQ